MAAISLKVDSEFLEMDNAVIRITYTNNLFEEGAAPGVASYPFDLPPTPHNLRILGQHNRLDNPESLLGTVPVSAFLYDDFYMDCLLSFQSIGGNISAALVATTKQTFENFTTKKLEDLDFGQFNKYYIPETYRYSIGQFAFSNTDTLQIDIDSYSYFQTPLATPIETVLALIAQVNADTANNKCTAKYLKQVNNFGPPVIEYAVLFKGTDQFTIYPQDISAPTGTPGIGLYVPIINHFNDPFVSPRVSNQARHMEHVNSEFDLYKLSFGDFPYRFPVIYNENFFGPPIATAIYDYFINTFNPGTQKYLTRFATGQQLNTERSDTPVCEQIFLKYLVEQIFLNYGLQLDTTFFQNKELANLLLLNIASQSRIERNELAYNGPQFFEFSKSVPADTTIADFFIDFKKTFSQHFFYDFRQSKVLMLSSREILDSSDYFDLNPHLLAKDKLEPFEKYAGGFTINYIFDSEDEYPKNEIIDITAYKSRFSVPDLASLPLTGNWQDDVTLVTKKNKFYLVNTKVTPNVWAFLSENFQTEIFHKGSVKLDSGLEPVLILENAGRKTGATVDPMDESGTTFIPVITPSGMNIPKVKQEGYSIFHQLLNVRNTGRLMFWRGFDYQNYPKANYDVFDDIGVKRYQYSLRLTGTEGTINRFHEPFIRNLSAIKKKVIKTALLDKNQILNYKPWMYHRVESQNMLCGKMDVIFDNAKNCIRPAQFELYAK